MVDGARAGIKKASDKVRRAEAFLRFRFIQHLHGCVACGELGKAFIQILFMAIALGAVQGAVPHSVTLDLMFLDQVKNQCRRGGEGRVQLLPGLLAQRILNFLRRRPKPGIDQTHISARAAKADGFSFEQNDVQADFAASRAAAQPENPPPIIAKSTLD